MSDLFKIQAAEFIIPDYGKIDTRKKLTQKTQLDLYLHDKFPFITPTEKAIPFLKKQKISFEVLEKLVARSTTVEEVQILAQVNTSDEFKKVIENKLDKFSF